MCTAPPEQKLSRIFIYFTLLLLMVLKYFLLKLKNLNIWILRFLYYMTPFVLVSTVVSFLLKIKSHQAFDLYQKMTVADFEDNNER